MVAAVCAAEVCLRRLHSAVARRVESESLAVDRVREEGAGGGQIVNFVIAVLVYAEFRHGNLAFAWCLDTAPNDPSQERLQIHVGPLTIRYGPSRHRLAILASSPAGWLFAPSAAYSDVRNAVKRVTAGALRSSLGSERIRISSMPSNLPVSRLAMNTNR